MERVLKFGKGRIDLFLCTKHCLRDGCQRIAPETSIWLLDFDGAILCAHASDLKCAALVRDGNCLLCLMATEISRTRWIAIRRLVAINVSKLAFAHGGSDS